MLKRQKQLTVRFTDEEYPALKRTADTAGMQIEPFVRQLVEGYTIKPRPPDSYVRLSQQVAAVGNNLNQLAHIANATGKVSDHSLQQAQQLMEEIWELLAENI